MILDGHNINPRALMLCASSGVVYEDGARDMHMRTNVCVDALRVYAALLGERRLSPLVGQRQRKPVVRTQQRRNARLELQAMREVDHD